MLEKNNKISVLTKMIGIGDEKTPQLIVPQNSLTNFHARMGLSEKSVNMAGSGGGGGVGPQTPTISCPHCQNMAKNFLYLESLIRANGSPKNKCSLCSSTLRYVEYVNKSILDVFAKNASIIEAAQKYSTVKPRFRMPKLMSRVSRLTGGGKKTAAGAATTAVSDSPHHRTSTAAGSNSRRPPMKKKIIKTNDTVMGKTVIVKSSSRASKTSADKSAAGRKADKTKSSKNANKQQQHGSKSSLRTGKSTGAGHPAATGRSSAENISKGRKLKTGKKTSATLKKDTLKAKRLADTAEEQHHQAFAA